jgi:ubiquitin
MGQIIKDGDYVMAKEVPERLIKRFATLKPYKLHDVFKIKSNFATIIDDRGKEQKICIEASFFLDGDSWTKCDKKGNEIK